MAKSEQGCGRKRGVLTAIPEKELSKKKTFIRKGEDRGYWGKGGKQGGGIGELR